MWTQTAVLERSDEAEAFMELSDYSPVWPLDTDDIELLRWVDDDDLPESFAGWDNVAKVTPEYGEPFHVGEVLSDAIEDAELDGYRVVSSWPSGVYIQRRIER